MAEGGLDVPDVELVSLSEEELRAMTADELLALAEDLGVYLDVNGTKEAMLGRLFRLGM